MEPPGEMIMILLGDYLGISMHILIYLGSVAVILMRYYLTRKRWEKRRYERKALKVFRERRSLLALKPFFRCT